MGRDTASLRAGPQLSKREVGGRHSRQGEREGAVSSAWGVGARHWVGCGLSGRMPERPPLSTEPWASGLGLSGESRGAGGLLLAYPVGEQQSPGTGRHRPRHSRPARRSDRKGRRYGRAHRHARGVRGHQSSHGAHTALDPGAEEAGRLRGPRRDERSGDNQHDRAGPRPRGRRFPGRVAGLGMHRRLPGPVG